MAARRERPEYNPDGPEYLGWVAEKLEKGVYGFGPINPADLARILREHGEALRFRWRLKKAELALKVAQKALEEIRGKSDSDL